MEIHHHSHTARKKWTHYLWEFLMLFLAVFCGFLAENIREKFVERHREKEYAQSLYNDLKIDTAVQQRTIEEKSWITTKYDSALNMLSGNSSFNNGFLYYTEQYLTFNDVFTSQDVTYQQLKNSGNFRYFRKPDLYKELADYYNLYTRYQSVDGEFGFQKEDMNDIEAALFDPVQLSALYNEQPDTFYDLALRPEGKVFNPLQQDKQALKKLYLKIVNRKYRANGSKVFLFWLKDKAARIIGLVKDEYHLK